MKNDSFLRLNFGGLFNSFLFATCILLYYYTVWDDSVRFWAFELLILQHRDLLPRRSAGLNGGEVGMLRRAGQAPRLHNVRTVYKFA